MNFVTYVQFDTAERTLLQSAGVFLQDEDRVENSHAPTLALLGLAHESLPVPAGRCETAAGELHRAHTRLGKDYEAGRLSREDWNQFQLEFDPAYQLLVKAVDQAGKVTVPKPGGGQRKGMSPTQFGEHQRNRVIEFIKAYVKEHEASPSIAEIAEGLDISETNAGRHIRKLLEEGRLEKGRGHRAWRVVRKSKSKS